MGLFDTILGRTKPVRANLDALFALPAAAVTLQVSAGLVATGQAGVCFKPPAGQPFAEMQAELEQLLATPDDDGLASSSPATASASGAGAAPSPGKAPTVRHVGDKFGYRWILVDAASLDDLVTRVHMVHSSLQDAGWSTQLLCSVFSFAPGPPGTAADDPSGGTDAPVVSIDAITKPIYIVYLAKQGTFYPFAPSGGEQRDTELELRLPSVIDKDLPIESDLSRWFPIWDIPVA